MQKEKIRHYFYSQSGQWKYLEKDENTLLVKPIKFGSIWHKWLNYLLKLLWNVLDQIDIVD